MQSFVRRFRWMGNEWFFHWVSVFIVLCCLVIEGGRAQAQVVPIYYFDDQGIEANSQRLMEKTLVQLGEQIPGHEFQITPIDPAVRGRTYLMSHPGLFFGDASQSLLLEQEIPLRPVAIIERRFQNQQGIRGAGVLIARADSGHKRFQDISRRVVGGVRGKPLLSWLAVSRAASSEGISLDSAPSQIEWFPTDQAVVRAVLDRDVELGVVSSSVIEGMSVRGELDMEELVVVTASPAVSSQRDDFPFWASTDLYPDYRLMAFESLPSELVRQIGATVFSVAAEELFPEEALQLAWSLPISCAEAQALMQELRLPPFQNHGRPDFVSMIRRHLFLFIGIGALLIVLAMTTSYVLALNRSLQEEIDDRNRAQQVMKQSVERFEDIVACSGDWIWETDHKEIFTYCSDGVEKLLGWKPAALIGESMLGRLSTAERQELENGRLLQDGKALKKTLRMLTADGRVVVHECVAVAVRNPNGSLAGYRGVNRDITASQRVVSFGDE